MGIRCLNKFLTKYCSNSITKLHLNELNGKRIAIDANIYMYEFYSEGKLMEGFYYMISIFKYYNIEPIFIFDGKTPENKYETIKERQANKIIAENKYNKLAEIYDENCQELINLRKQFIRLSKNHFSDVKNLIEYMGITYIEAPFEADEICAKLVLTNSVYGCLSEDTDMFAYGCTRIFKNINLKKETIVEYNLCNILKYLNINLENFKQLCVISGTDYNKETKGFMYYYNIYKNKYRIVSNKYHSFYEWLYMNNYNYDYDNLLKICSIYCKNKVFENEIIYKNNKFRRNDLQNLLKKHNFIFVN